MEDGDAGSDCSAQDGGSPIPVVPSEDDRTDAEDGQCFRPRRILDRSTSITQREDNLASRALVITVLSGSSGAILGNIAGRFEVEVSLMSLQRFGDARFLLILPDEELAGRVYNDGRPFISTELRLHVMRWTRLLNSTAATLSSPVEVAISGIPAHAWELATAELLLGDHCWIGGVHLDTTDHRDTFKVVAWSSRPASIPPVMDLEIVEPPMQDDDQHPEKRTLVYPVSLSVVPVGLPSRPVDAPSPPPADNGRRRQERRRPGSLRTPAAAGALRALVQERLGRWPEAADHVEPRDSASLEPSQSVALAPVHAASTPVEGIHVPAAVVPPEEAFAWETEGVSPGPEATPAYACSPITAGGAMAAESVQAVALEAPALEMEMGKEGLDGLIIDGLTEGDKGTIEGANGLGVLTGIAACVEACNGKQPVGGGLEQVEDMDGVGSLSSMGQSPGNTAQGLGETSVWSPTLEKMSAIPTEEPLTLGACPPTSSPWLSENIFKAKPAPDELFPSAA